MLEGSQGDALHGSKAYNAITWWKPRIVAHLVDRGFVAHMSGGWTNGGAQKNECIPGRCQSSRGLNVKQW